MEVSHYQLEAFRRLKKAALGDGLCCWDSGKVEEYKKDYNLFGRDQAITAKFLVDNYDELMEGTE